MSTPDPSSEADRPVPVLEGGDASSSGPLGVAVKFVLAMARADVPAAKLCMTRASRDQPFDENPTAVTRVVFGPPETEADGTLIPVELFPVDGQNQKLPMVLVTEEGEPRIDLQKSMEKLFGMPPEQFLEQLGEGMKQAMQPLAEGLGQAMAGLGDAMSEAFSGMGSAITGDPGNGDAAEAPRDDLELWALARDRVNWIMTELINTGLYRDEPLEGDPSSFAEWIQFVVVPDVIERIDGQRRLPWKTNLGEQAREHLVAPEGVDLQPIHDALAGFDAFIENLPEAYREAPGD